MDLADADGLLQQLLDHADQVLLMGALDLVVVACVGDAVFVGRAHPCQQAAAVVDDRNPRNFQRWHRRGDQVLN